MTLRLHPDEIVRASTSALLSINPTWERARLGDVAAVLNGFAFSSNGFSKNSGTPLLRIRDVGRSSTDVRYVGEFDATYVAERGDIVVGMDGDFRVARWEGGRALLNQRVCKITVRDEDTYSSAFLLHALPGYLDAIHAETSSVTVKHLSSRTIQDIPLPLPPILEQRRIVAAIEEQFSRLAAGEAWCRRARRNLRRMRQAVLWSAFDGWPTEHLVEVTDAERPICYGILKPKTTGNLTVPYVEVRSIRDGGIDVAALHRTTQELHEEFRRSELREGDVVLAIRGSFDRAAVVPAELQGANVSRDVARIAPKRVLEPAFLAYYLGGPHAYAYFSNAARGVGVRGVNIGDLRTMPVPMPTPRQQRDVVSSLEQALSIVSRMGAEIDLALARAATLRRSILADAFAGRIVPQDPTDEPASILLGRIRAARSATSNVSRKSRKVPA